VARVVHDGGNALMSGRWFAQRLGQQVGQVEHLDSVVAKRLGERVVLLLRTADPWDAVEQQLVVVAGGEPLQLRSRPMEQDGPEPTDLRVGA
jgi:hypothetical protein